MKRYVMSIGIGLLLSSAVSYAGRDGAQLMLQEQLNKRAAAERQGRVANEAEIRACQASARRTWPTETNR